MQDEKKPGIKDLIRAKMKKRNYSVATFDLDGITVYLKPYGYGTHQAIMGRLRDATPGQSLDPQQCAELLPAVVAGTVQDEDGRAVFTIHEAEDFAGNDFGLFDRLAIECLKVNGLAGSEEKKSTSESPPTCDLNTTCA